MTKINEKFTDKEKLWFTSDTHFGHFNIIDYCDRPFLNLENMNDRLIRNWNDLVGHDDVVFHLGDFALCHPREAEKILQELNGHIYLIAGNHEKTVLKKEFNRNMFEDISDILEISVVDGELDTGEANIVMCHYPMLSWRGSKFGAIHLYGHVHGAMTHPSPKALEVGVDVNDYKPVFYQQIKTYITKKSMGK